MAESVQGPWPCTQMVGVPHYQGHSLGQQEKPFGTLGITSDMDYNTDYREWKETQDLKLLCPLHPTRNKSVRVNRDGATGLVLLHA